MLRRARLCYLAAVTVVLVSCSSTTRAGDVENKSASTPRPVAAQQNYAWSRLPETPDLAGEQNPVVVESLSVEGKWYVVAQDASSLVEVLQSTDGSHWNAVTPAGYAIPAYRATGYPQKLLAATKDRAYL